jgi:hypothetical protein
LISSQQRAELEIYQVFYDWELLPRHPPQVYLSYLFEPFGLVLHHLYVPSLHHLHRELQYYVIEFIQIFLTILEVHTYFLV